MDVADLARLRRHIAFLEPNTADPPSTSTPNTPNTPTVFKKPMLRLRAFVPSMELAPWLTEMDAPSVIWPTRTNRTSSANTTLWTSSRPQAGKR